jgi:ferredoxin
MSLPPEIRVAVDPELCMGNQLCLGEAPTFFALDQDGHARVIAVVPFGEADLPILRAAEALCPPAAIRVEVIAHD